MKFKVGGQVAARGRRPPGAGRPACAGRFLRVQRGRKPGLDGRRSRRGSPTAPARDIVPLCWFEEPCEWPDDRQAMQAVRFKTGVPVAAGQSEISRIGMRDLMTAGAIDISNFDASWGGAPPSGGASRRWR